MGSLCSDKKKIEFQLVLLTKSKKMLLAQGHLFAFVCLDPCLGKLANKITCQTSKSTCSGQVERTFFKYCHVNQTQTTVSQSFLH